MVRKTIAVSFIRNQINYTLASFQSDGNDEPIKGQVALFEHILHETGNYRGFCYLHEHEVPHGQLPGINNDLSFDDTNPYRRYYF